MRRQAFIARNLSCRTKNSMYDDGSRQPADDGYTSVEGSPSPTT